MITLSQNIFGLTHSIVLDCSKVSEFEKYYFEILTSMIHSATLRLRLRWFTPLHFAQTSQGGNKWSPNNVNKGIFRKKRLTVLLLTTLGQESVKPKPTLNLNWVVFYQESSHKITLLLWNIQWNTLSTTLYCALEKVIGFKDLHLLLLMKYISNEWNIMNQNIFLCDNQIPDIQSGEAL